MSERERQLESEVERLKAAIRRHRDQKADDRCVFDDDVLYEALGDGIKCDRRVGDKFEMLKNCARFIDRRCEGGVWPSYAELEAKCKRMQTALERIERWFDEFPSTGHFYASGREMSYGAAYGSNGERDFMRGIAREALNPS